MCCDRSVVLFAGGGTGGHICPALAVSERFSEIESGVGFQFVCSTRAIDSEILSESGVSYKALPMRAFPQSKLGLIGFAWNYVRSRRRVSRLLGRKNVKCVVSVGGFVSVPVVKIAVKRGIPVVMINLDSVPGKANKLLARQCAKVFSVYDIELPGVSVIEKIAMPLRRSAIGLGGKEYALRKLGFNTEKPLLFVSGGSHGAKSIDEMMIELMENEDVVESLSDWQVLHLAGVGDMERIEEAYLSKHIDATVKSFASEMGLIWLSSDLAIGRAGASSVAEVVANEVPTIFLPYPYHEDMHQRHNAEPLVEAGGAVIFDDMIDPHENARGIADMLIELLGDGKKRRLMSESMGRIHCGNGTERIAESILELIDSKVD